MTTTTTTERQRIARRARQHGYFDTGRTLWVTCPACRHRVECDRELPHRMTIVRQLDRMMLGHLADYCEAQR